MSDDQAEAELGVVPLKVTLKAGAGFEAPWLTVEADTTAELVAQLVACQTDGVMEQITAASRALRSTFSAAPSSSERSSESRSGATPQTESKAAPPPSNPTSTPSSSSSGAAEATSGGSSSGVGPETPQGGVDRSTAQNVTAEADPIKAALDAVDNYADLKKVYPEFKNKGWTNDHTKYAQERANQLGASK